MTDMHAVAAAWQLEQIASRDAWDSRRVPVPVPDDQEVADVGGFHVEMPAQLARRASIAKFLRETATRAATGRSGGGGAPVLRFLADLATAAEHGGTAEISVAGLTRTDLESIRRIFVIASDRAGLAEDTGGVAVPQFARALLSSWEQHTNYRPPRPGTVTDRWGEAIRQGDVPANERGYISND